MKPGCSALVESDSSRSTPSSPKRANPARSVRRPARGADTDGQRVGDGVVDREELQAEGTEVVPFPLLHQEGLRLDAVLPQFGGDQRQGELGTDERDVGALAQQERNAADVVLVPVGEDDRVDVVEPAADVVEVRQDQVDPGLFLLGEEHTTVHDQ